MLLTEAEFNSIPAADWILRDLLIRHGLHALIGEPGSYKTFLALDWALSIAAGLPTWFGKPLHQSGPVVYVVAEGQVVDSSAAYRVLVGGLEREGANQQAIVQLPAGPL